MAKVLIFIFYA